MLKLQEEILRISEFHGLWSFFCSCFNDEPVIMILKLICSCPDENYVKQT